MITCSFRGQLGNQMFIAATVIAHAIKMNTFCGFPKRSGKRGQFPFMFPQLPQEPFNYSCEIYKEKRFGVYEELPLNDNLHLMGYWQSEKYFKQYRKQILEAFGMPRFETNKNTVSIHIRRGDSLRYVEKLPQPTGRYLRTAMNHFVGKKFLVFSDDIEWCKQHFIGDQFEFVEPGDAKINMGRMASCEHNIIVNSTFSWWGAWLGDQTNRVVICPHSDSWFGEAYKNRLSAQDIPCENWIQIKY